MKKTYISLCLLIGGVSPAFCSTSEFREEREEEISLYFTPPPINLGNLLNFSSSEKDLKTAAENKKDLWDSWSWNSSESESSDDSKLPLPDAE